MKTPQAAKVCYFAAIYAEKKGGYWATFVDFSGADQGETLEETVKNLTDFLQDIIDNMSFLHQEIPKPSTIEEFKKKLDPKDGEPVCIVPIFAYPPSPSIRVQITAKANQIAEIDKYAREHNLTRSEMMVNAALLQIR